MNLNQVIRAIERTAALQPPVSTIVRNDVFRLNAFPAVQYGVVAWLQGEHRTSGDGYLMEWAFTLFYVDRLTENRGNEVQIQSTGIEVLENILRTLEGAGIFAGEYSFQVFNQRFTDECAGVYARVTLETAKDGICPAEWLTPGESSLVWNAGAGVWEWTIGGRTIKIV